MSGELIAVGIEGLPEVAPGDPLGELIARALSGPLRAGDAIVISQKVVSKSEGRVVELGSVTPGDRATDLARELGRDPRVVELVLAESAAVIRAERGVLIVRTNGGLVCANAGIDSSNVPGEDRVALLPEDPDASARRIREELRIATGAAPAVVIADSFGRAWRMGQVEVAIGCAGLVALDDWRGRGDRDGRELAATAIGVADEVAGAADLVRDKSAGVPAVLVRGLERWVTAEDGPGAAVLRRPQAEDLFS
jgi:coenzyme F420-0:L-glutamate ligase / coenzyme F420-1:gamma-L-glutamate ligase